MNRIKLKTADLMDTVEGSHSIPALMTPISPCREGNRRDSISSSQFSFQSLSSGLASFKSVPEPCTPPYQSIYSRPTSEFSFSGTVSPFETLPGSADSAKSRFTHGMMTGHCTSTDHQAMSSKYPSHDLSFHWHAPTRDTALSNDWGFPTSQPSQGLSFPSSQEYPSLFGPSLSGRYVDEERSCLVTPEPSSEPTSPFGPCHALHHQLLSSTPTNALSFDPPQGPTSYCDVACLDLGRSTIIPSHTFMTPQPIDADPVDLSYDVHTPEPHTSALWSPASDDELQNFRSTRFGRVGAGRKRAKTVRKHSLRKQNKRKQGRGPTVALRSGPVEVFLGENIRAGPDGRLEADRELAPKEHHQCSIAVTNSDGVTKRCGRTFKRQEHLKRHELTTHSDRKPYKCPVVFRETENGRRKSCGREFNRHDNLCEHYRTHLTNSNAPRNARLSPSELFSIIRKNSDPEHVKKVIPKLQKIVAQLKIPHHPVPN